jgi:hypothetical protein
MKSPRFLIDVPNRRLVIRPKAALDAEEVVVKFVSRKSAQFSLGIIGMVGEAHKSNDSLAPVALGQTSGVRIETLGQVTGIKAPYHTLKVTWDPSARDRGIRAAAHQSFEITTNGRDYSGRTDQKKALDDALLRLLDGRGSTQDGLRLALRLDHFGLGPRDIKVVGLEHAFHGEHAGTHGDGSCAEEPAPLELYDLSGKYLAYSHSTKNPGEFMRSAVSVTKKSKGKFQVEMQCGDFPYHGDAIVSGHSFFVRMHCHKHQEWVQVVLYVPLSENARGTLKGVFCEFDGDRPVAGKTVWIATKLPAPSKVVKRVSLPAGVAGDLGITSQALIRVPELPKG